MNKLRAKFSRNGEIKYISHLDTMRTFERAARRAGIPIAYSQGFNPRPQMSFGLPLPVGVTSEAEYLDIDMEEKIPEHEFIEKMNSSMPNGFRITEAGYIEPKESLMSSIGMASYIITAELAEQMGKDEVVQNIDSFLQKEEIMVEKKSKGNTKVVNIKPDIFEIGLKDIGSNNMVLGMTLSAGSSSNLKPELVIKALNSVEGMNMAIAEIHRTALYGKGGAQLLKR